MLAKSQLQTAFVLALGIAAGAGLTITQAVRADKSASAQTIPLHELQTFAEILTEIKENYVEDVEDSELLEDAVRGMLSGLDPHSAYLDKDEFKELTISTSGKFGGLGIEVQMQDGFVRVVAPIDDTPADRAGMQAGDLVIRIDDAPVKGMTLTEAVRLMRGKPGTDIELTVVREGLNQPINVKITRDIIKVKSVRSRILEEGYGYVRVSHFSSATGPNVHNEIEDLISENEGQLKGLVLDLRNNPGGVLNAAVDVSDLFLEKGTIVSIRGRDANQTREFNAKPGDSIDDAPVVVLINGGSASASEIVAGALQDHKRAVIMGRKSFGKGSVQTIVPVQNNAAIKLTTARYYTPTGRSIQAKGIDPDIIIDPVTVAKRESNGFTPVKEADLSGSLKNENGDADKAKDGEKESLAEKDFELHEALNLLKGLHIITSR